MWSGSEEGSYLRFIYCCITGSRAIKKREEEDHGSTNPSSPLPPVPPREASYGTIVSI